MAIVQLRQIRCVQTVNGESSDNISIIIAKDSPASILFESSDVFTNGKTVAFNDMTLQFNQQLRVHLIRMAPPSGNIDLVPLEISASEHPFNGFKTTTTFPQGPGLLGLYEIEYGVRAPNVSPIQPSHPLGQVTYSEQDTPGIPATFITPAVPGVPISWTVELDHQAVQSFTGDDAQSNVSELAGAAGAPAGVTEVLIGFLVAIRAADATNGNGARVIYTYITNATVVLPR